METRVAMCFLTLALAIAGAAVASPDAESTPLALYARMHAALAGDSAEGVATAARELAGQVRAEGKLAGDAAAYDALAVAAERMQGSDLAALRAQFKEISKAFAGYVNASGVEGAQLYFCPMADGYWWQRSADATVSNPYYGRSMLRCGSKADKVEG